MQADEKPRDTDRAKLYENSCNTGHKTYNGILYLNTYDIIDGIPFEYLIMLQIQKFEPLEGNLLRDNPPDPDASDWEKEVLMNKLWPAIARSYTDDYVDLTQYPSAFNAGMTPVRCGDESSKSTLFANVAECKDVMKCGADGTFDRAVRIRNWDVRLELYDGDQFTANIFGKLQVISSDEEGYWPLTDDEFNQLAAENNITFQDRNLPIQVKEVLWYVEPDMLRSHSEIYGASYSIDADPCPTFRHSYDHAIYMKTYNDITFVMHFGTRYLVRRPRIN